MSTKSEIVDHIIELEGGYVNDPSDSGGETNYGITEAIARSEGYVGAIKDLPRSLAFDIYSRRYWDSVQGDSIGAMSEVVVAEVVDTAVNMGVSRAGRFLQRSLNSLIDADLVVDGRIGPSTLRALGDYLAVRDEAVLLTALNCLQGAYYIELTERREKDKRFVYGWLRNRVQICSG